MNDLLLIFKIPSNKLFTFPDSSSSDCTEIYSTPSSSSYFVIDRSSSISQAPPFKISRVEYDLNSPSAAGIKLEDALIAESQYQQPQSPAEESLSPYGSFIEKQTTEVNSPFFFFFLRYLIYNFFCYRTLKFYYHRWLLQCIPTIRQEC